MIDENDLNIEIQRTTELLVKTRNILENLGIQKEMKQKEEVIFNKSITKAGDGSHIMLPQKYIGHKGTIIIKKKQEDVKK